MQESLFSQGFTLLVFGMGTVFMFLAVLVVVTNCVSTLMMRYFPEPIEALIKVKKVARPQGKIDAKTLKILQAAVDQHRQKQSR